MPNAKLKRLGLNLTYVTVKKNRKTSYMLQMMSKLERMLVIVKVWLMLTKRSWVHKGSRQRTRKLTK